MSYYRLGRIDLFFKMSGCCIGWDLRTAQLTAYVRKNLRKMEMIDLPNEYRAWEGTFCLNQLSSSILLLMRLFLFYSIPLTLKQKMREADSLDI